MLFMNNRKMYVKFDDVIRLSWGPQKSKPLRMLLIIKRL